LGLYSPAADSWKKENHVRSNLKVYGVLAFAAIAGVLIGQAPPAEPAPRAAILPLPDPKEIPLPIIKTSQTPMPDVAHLKDHPELPDVMTLNNGQKVKTAKQWAERRAEMTKTLEWYAVGQAPPPPGNVKGKEISSELLLDGKVKYRLVHLTFGPNESLSLDIGIYTPTGPGGDKVPTLISPSGTPPGATALPRLAQGANQGRNEDVLLVTGPAVPGAGGAGGGPGGAGGGARGPRPAGPDGAGGAPVAGMGGAAGAPAGAGAPGAAARRPGGGGGFGGPRTPEQTAASNQAIQHGYGFITFNNGDCGEDTTLRLADGSWAYRTTRFFPAYPNYDWGLLRAWAWGVSRIVDFIQTDPTIDKTKLIVTGVSRTGKSALIAGSFDDRIAMVAPVASSGGGTPSYRYSGSVPDRGGKEGLTEMVRKYPNWYSDHLHQFWGQPDKLPFDENWFIALCAPRPFISLEGDHDQNVNQNGVWHSIEAAKPAYNFLNASNKIGISFADRPHGMVQGDWDALLAFGDKFLMGKPSALTFDKYPPGMGPNAPAK
jgi:Abhydrolase family